MGLEQVTGAAELRGMDEGDQGSVVAPMPQGEGCLLLNVWAPDGRG